MVILENKKILINFGKQKRDDKCKERNTGKKNSIQEN